MRPELIVYNFEGAIEPAVGTVFVSQGLVAYTANGKVNADGTLTTDLDLQKDRPRVEIMLTPGAGQRRWHLMHDSDPLDGAVETLWNASMSVDLITNADPLKHFEWLAITRWTCPRICQVNGNALKYHKIHGPIRMAGESHSYDAKSGFYLTKINVIFDFSIHADGWALFNQP